MNQIAKCLGSGLDAQLELEKIGFKYIGDSENGLTDYYFHTKEKFFIAVNNNKLEFRTYCENNRGDF